MCHLARDTGPRSVSKTWQEHNYSFLTLDVGKLRKGSVTKLDIRRTVNNGP